MDEISSKNILIGKVHDTLYDTSRSVGVTDTILVCGTYIFNLAMLFLIAISVEKTAIYAVFILTLIIVNLLILATFKNSRQLREKMHLRQKSLYEDLGLIKHFDDSLNLSTIRSMFRFGFVQQYHIDNFHMKLNSCALCM